MLILDTDHLSIMDQDNMEAFNLGRRLAAVPEGEVTVTVITYEEQMHGWLAYVARADTMSRQIDAYAKLRQHVERFRDIPMLPYDAAAATEFERLREARIRVGTMDLRIAAIALTHGATLLTRNLTDFGKIPGLRAEDWSA